MSYFLGIDTSNYTTSAAVYETDGGVLWQQKKLLPVKPGEMGLRQCDAVFHHVRQLPDMMEALCTETGPLSACMAIGVSDRPQQAERSYMPCFLAGLGTARSLAAFAGKPLYQFTHQQGHVAAALYGSGHLDWVERPFLAFHVSGGTTDALLVEPDGEAMIRCRVIAHSLDLKAGQLIDRVGGMLGLSFPAGKALEELASHATGCYRPRAATEDGCCHLSGVENQCRRMVDEHKPPEEVARFCLMSVLAAVSAMTEWIFSAYGTLPLLYAGGVMSDTILKEALTARFGGHFAPAVFSTDNAAGIAVLTALKNGGTV